MLRNEARQVQQALDDIERILQRDPQNEEALETRRNLLEVLQLTRSSIAESVKPTVIETSVATDDNESVTTNNSNEVPKLQVHTRVLAHCPMASTSDKDLHVARIEAIEGPTYTVTFLHNQESADFLETDQHHFEPHSSDILVPGQPVLALFYDGDLNSDVYDYKLERFVEAVVENISTENEGWYRIRYKHDRSRAEVSGYDLYVPDSMKGKRVMIPAAIQAIVDPHNAQFVIPEHLRFRPTDSESERRNKRLKVRRLQQTFNANLVKALDDRKVSSWKEFSTNPIHLTTDTKRRRVTYAPVMRIKGNRP